MNEEETNEDGQEVLTTPFNEQFNKAYEEFSAGGWATLAHHGTMVIMAISAIISFVWFATLVPGLILDPAQYPTLSRLLSGLIGVAMMEGAATLWHFTQQKVGLSKTQLNIAFVGKWLAIAASVITSFVAIASLVGGTQDMITKSVLAFANSSGIGYYFALQFALFILYRFSGTESAKARHTASVAANEAAIAHKTEAAISTSRLASAEVLSQDMKTLAKYGAVSSHQNQLEVLRKQMGVEGPLADQFFEEIARENYQVEEGKAQGWKSFFSRRPNQEE